MKNYTAINKEQYNLDDYRKSDEYNSLQWEEREKIEASQQKLYEDYVRHSGGWEKSDFGKLMAILTSEGIENAFELRFLKVYGNS